VYSYSLKQGIHDGFLAPYKVIKVHIDRDVEGYRPEPGKLDREGEEVEDRIYNTRDFDRTLVIDDRTKLVAKKSPLSSRRVKTDFRKPSCSVSMRSTPRACGKRWSTRTQTSTPKTTATSCASPEATRRGKISLETSSIQRAAIP